MSETTRTPTEAKAEATAQTSVRARVRVTRTLHFSAAHRLNREDWSEAKNREVFGLCANPNWHGHNYELDVTVDGPIDPQTGYVLDLKVLRELVEARVIADIDHRNLNVDVAWLAGTNPTTENLVVAIWRRLEGVLPAGVRLARLVLHETARNAVEYTGERE
ncbi:MAG: 6-pyruvoyl trahydropterin synthase family protein [Longimicrobiales bacterium]